MRDLDRSITSVWRLILSPPAPGARAMATDEALLDACAADPGRFPPVLRLYAFDPVCLSLGRFQRLADVDLTACARSRIDVVRRPSGGRAVLHDRCLTYALVAPAEAPPFAGGVRTSAHRIGEALAAGIRRLGAPVALASSPPRGVRPADCFALPGAGEVVSDGRKLAGSAQVRRGGAALQHGTIRLRSGAGLAAPLLRDRERQQPVAAVPPAALDALLGRPVTFTEAAAAVAAGFAESFGVMLAGGFLTEAELHRAARLQAERYAVGEQGVIALVSP